jgi:hypothetical protein
MLKLLRNMNLNLNLNDFFALYWIVIVILMPEILVGSNSCIILREVSLILWFGEEQGSLPPILLTPHNHNLNHVSGICFHSTFLPPACLACPWSLVLGLGLPAACARVPSPSRHTSHLTPYPTSTSTSTRLVLVLAYQHQHLQLLVLVASRQAAQGASAISLSTSASASKKKYFK